MWLYILNCVVMQKRNQKNFNSNERKNANCMRLPQARWERCKILNEYDKGV